MNRNVIAAPMISPGLANLNGGCQASAVIREGCHVLNGTVAGAAIGAAICPLGGAELGAAIGGWIGSKVAENSGLAGK